MLRPMLASLADAPLADPQLVYEPKYDGIRAIVEIDADGPRAPVVAARQREDASVPGDRRGARDVGARAQGAARRSCSTARSSRSTPKASRPAFRSCRGGFICRRRRQPSGPSSPSRPSSPSPVGVHRLRHPARGPHRSSRSAAARAARACSSACSLPRRHAGAPPAMLRISEMVRGDGRALYKRALASGWEGLIAKQADSRVSIRQAHAGLAQAEDRPRAGVRDRRLDRAAPDAVVLRRAAARRVRRRSQAQVRGLGGSRPRWSTSGTPEPDSTSASWRG